MNHEEYYTIREAFRKIWGYEDFRPPQEEIIRCLLSSQDALIVMPTGGGKSICFQLPALLQKGITLVVSPLIALMENQVKELRERNLAAALLHSQLPKYERKQTLEAIGKGKLRLLYLSPETLLSPPVWQQLSQPFVEINGLILDEAHCLVQWGETFRPAYRRLGTVRRTLLQSKPQKTKIAIAVFTATADTNAQKIITQTLELKQPQTFLISPYRNNLHLKIQTIWTPRGRRQEMFKFIQARDKQGGLVYVHTRRDSEEIAAWFCSLGYRTAAYHAGLSATQRRKIESNWLSGETQFAVCTSAFGMGINKPHVPWVVHFQTPQFLSEYLQEVGRAGRNGKRADILTLISEPTGWFNPEDKQQRQFLARQWEKQYRTARQIEKQIPPQGEVEKVGRQFPGGDLALALLNSAGKLKWTDPFHYRRCSGNSSPSLGDMGKMQQKWQEQMTQYLRTKECRWQFLLHSFGFKKEALGFKCGHCDNCTNGVS